MPINICTCGTLFQHAYISKDFVHLHTQNRSSFFSKILNIYVLCIYKPEHSMYVYIIAICLFLILRVYFLFYLHVYVLECIFTHEFRFLWKPKLSDTL